MPIDLSELQSLAVIASTLPDIVVTVGEPGCPWSFNLGTRIITANPVDLALRQPDYCRGLILHESAHGALTRLGDIVPAEIHDRALHRLLNVVEDCRIENWLMLRFPGCRPWIRLYNDRLSGPAITPRTRERIAADPAAGLLTGLLCQWWHGELTERVHPLAAAALAEVKPHFDEAVAAHPPALPPAAGEVLALYRRHPVAACFRALDRAGEPTAEECLIRMTQHRMWDLTWQHIVPVFHRLLDRPESTRTLQFLASRGGAPTPGRVRRTRLAPEDFHNGGITPTAGTRAGRTTAETQPAMAADRQYDRAAAGHAELIESCAAVLLRLLVAETRPKTTRLHRSGIALDPRTAMQFEADPRLHDRLFLRRTLPTRPDPAFIVIVDESGSMEGERARATFAAVVVMREVCLRLGIPLAVVGFSRRSRVLQGWDEADTAAVRRRIGALSAPAGRSSDLRPALDLARSLRARCPHDQLRLWILSDGEVDEPVECRRRLAACRADGVIAHGLGLGPDSTELVRVVPRARVGIQPEDLPAIFAEMLARQVSGCVSRPRPGPSRCG